jgi:hypothetical protein
MVNNRPNDRKEWLDLRALIEYACVSERTARGWIHRTIDPLPAYQVDRKLLIKRSEFDAWITQHGVRRDVTMDLDQVVDDVLRAVQKGA